MITLFLAIILQAQITVANGIHGTQGSLNTASASAGSLPLTQSAPSLKSVLNPDGTLNLKSGFSGSLDATGWQLASAPGMPPRFVPAGAVSASRDSESTKQSSAPLAPGDENWDGRFGKAGVSAPVRVLAMAAMAMYTWAVTSPQQVIARRTILPDGTEMGGQPLAAAPTAPSMVLQ